MPDSKGNSWGEEADEPTVYANGVSPSELEARGKGRRERVKLEVLRSHPLQPPERSADKSIAPLVESIRKVGLLQPILVWRRGDGSMIILAGHRRASACQVLTMEGVLDGFAEAFVLEEVSYEDTCLIVASEAFHDRRFSAVQRAEMTGIAHEIAERRLGRKPTTRDLAGILPRGRTQISDELVIYRALQDPKLEALVRQADKAGKSLLSSALKLDRFSTQRRILEVFLQEGRSDAWDLVREAQSERGRPEKPFTKKRRGKNGYDLLVRVRARMSMEETELALAALIDAQEDLDAKLSRRDAPPRDGG